jgi:hypothetical protein
MDSAQVSKVDLVVEPAALVAYQTRFPTELRGPLGTLVQLRSLVKVVGEWALELSVRMVVVGYVIVQAEGEPSAFLRKNRD